MSKLPVWTCALILVNGVVAGRVRSFRASTIDVAKRQAARAWGTTPERITAAPYGDPLPKRVAVPAETVSARRVRRNAPEIRAIARLEG